MHSTAQDSTELRRPRGGLVLWAMAAVMAGTSCVDLTPPWNQAHPQDGGDVALGGGGVITPGSGGVPTGGAGGMNDGGLPGGEASAVGGAGGGIDGQPAVPDASSAGGAGGSFDLGAGGIDVAAAGGAGGISDGGTTPDTAADVPMGGTGGSVLDASKDTRSDARGGTGGGTTARGGAGGSGTGGSSTGTGGAGTGGKTGTGGAGTGGAGTGGAGTGGSGTGGAGTGGVIGTGGAGIVSTANLLIYYPCDETSGSTLADASGNNRTATLATGTGGSGGYAFGTGRVNNALGLVKASQGYASISDTGLFGATAMTIATWVYLNSAVAWQRVWDFGNDTKAYMFLTTRSGTGNNVLRFGISLNSYGADEQDVDGTAELPIRAWHHVAVVLSGGTGYLYVDGTQVGTKTSMTLSPASLGTTTNNWIGKSQFYNAASTPDPYFDGNIDDFRVYSRALTPAEIGLLAAMKAP